MGFGSFAGGVASSIAGVALQDHYNRASAKRQMKWQEAMRATQYQTAMADMEKAGLNPILAYKQGGAGTPSGSAPTVGMPDIAGATAKMTSSQIQHKKLKTELQILQNTKDKLAAERGLTLKMLDAQDYKNQIARHQLPSLLNEADIDALTSKLKYDVVRQGSSILQKSKTPTKTFLNDFLDRLGNIFDLN